MKSNKSFFKKKLLNSILFSGMLILNTFNIKESNAKAKEIIDIPKIHRSASCSCCKMANHLRDNGLEVVDNIVEDIQELRNNINSQ